MSWSGGLPLRCCSTSAVTGRRPETLSALGMMPPDCLAAAAPLDQLGSRCFVIDDEYILHSHQVGHDPLDHLAVRFKRLQFLAGAPLQQLASSFGKLDALAQLEGVEIGDDDLGLVHRRRACRLVRSRGLRSSCRGRSVVGRGGGL